MLHFYILIQLYSKQAVLEWMHNLIKWTDTVQSIVYSEYIIIVHRISVIYCNKFLTIYSS